MKQLINLFALWFSGCVCGYAFSLPPAPSSPAVEPQTFTAVVSAYCACERCCPGTSDNITANGHRIRPGERFVAADKRFAFGTMLDIPGYGRIPVLDRGGAIKGNKLDVFFNSHAEAIRWGVKTLEVRVERNP